MEDRFVVTGTGHSGTAWVALALSSLGVPTTHEGIYTLAGPRPWPPRLRADVSLAAMPHLGDNACPSATIVVRDPLEVLNSFLRRRTFARRCPCHEPGAHAGAPFVQYVAGWVDFGGLDEDDELGHVIRYLVGWHELGAPYAPTVRLEDLGGGALPIWAWNVADVPTALTEELLGTLPNNVNAHGPSGPDRPWITWADIDAHPAGDTFRHYATELGYA